MKIFMLDISVFKNMVWIVWLMRLLRLWMKLRFLCFVEVFVLKFVSGCL